MLAVHGDDELIFCGHHGSKHMDALTEQGWQIADYRDKINSKPSVSANKE